MNPFARSVVAAQAVLAALLTLVGAADLSHVMSPTAAGWLALAAVAGQAGVAILAHARGFSVAVAVQLILATGQAVVAGGKLTDLVPHTAAVWVGLVVAMAQAGAAAYAAGVVVPTPASARLMRN